MTNSYGYSGLTGSVWSHFILFPAALTPPNPSLHLPLCGQWMYLWTHRRPGFLYRWPQSSGRCRWAASSARHSRRDGRESWCLDEKERGEQAPWADFFTAERQKRWAALAKSNQPSQCSHTGVVTLVLSVKGIRKKGNKRSEARMPHLSIVSTHFDTFLDFANVPFCHFFGLGRRTSVVLNMVRIMRPKTYRTTTTQHDRSVQYRVQITNHV